jgi:hypothetical protein
MKPAYDWQKPRHEQPEYQEWADNAWNVGNLVRDQDGKVYLVGDVNANSGVCGCCSLDDIVAYRPFLTAGEIERAKAE